MQTGHYAERTRLAGVNGLKDLLGRHPEQVPSHPADEIDSPAYVKEESLAVLARRDQSAT